MKNVVLTIEGAIVLLATYVGGFWVLVGLTIAERIARLVR